MYTNVLTFDFWPHLSFSVALIIPRLLRDLQFYHLYPVHSAHHSFPTLYTLPTLPTCCGRTKRSSTTNSTYANYFFYIDLCWLPYERIKFHYNTVKCQTRNIKAWYWSQRPTRAKRTQRCLSYNMKNAEHKLRKSLHELFQFNLLSTSLNFVHNVQNHAFCNCRKSKLYNSGGSGRIALGLFCVWGKTTNFDQFWNVLQKILPWLSGQTSMQIMVITFRYRLLLISATYRRSLTFLGNAISNHLFNNEEHEVVL